MNIPLTPIRFLRYAEQQFPKRTAVVCGKERSLMPSLLSVQANWLALCETPEFSLATASLSCA